MEFLEKVKIYSVKNSYILDVYGITRNPDTKEYIIVLKYVEDIGLYNMNQTQIYGVMPYVAPEVLKGKDYTEAADIYGLGMVMCWDSNPVNRPKATEVEELVKLFYYSYKYNKSHELDFKMIMKIEKVQEHYEIEKQFKEAEEFKKSNNLTVENNPITHSQAIYTSQLLNPFINDLLKM
ncbi:unnamed protein product [Rhizophagus irregularis]|uniref:Protein kinase domain-containing protein n=1 Tax=Rhizophagus irregularis TaxID=588596 RepID=A0A915Z2B8_9GLOM|nr:unnamed protein product [Rhizophagus irregularis]